MFKWTHFFKRKLIWYLFGCILLAGLLSAGCGYLVIQLGLDWIENRYDDQEMNKNLQIKYMADLQEYVTDNDITADTISELAYWTDKNTYVYVSIYQKNRVIFNSDYIYYDENAGDGSDDLLEEGELLDSENLYRLELADGSTASVDMFCYGFWKYNYYVWVMGIVISVALFIILFTRLFQRKLRYVKQIEKELQILEGGNLEYPVTVKGEDEISSLARGIEQMRLSIMENMKKEQKMLQTNKELVTAMSHDLRTPLTTLMGYLEILNMDHIREEEQRRHYLELSLAKTREIKELSDELFEYFLIYGEDSKRIQVEAVPAYDLVMDLVANQFFGLEEEGFSLATVNQIDETAGNCLINIKYMQRVLNNILSNLEKYADPETPIEISACREQNYMVLRVRNGIRENMEQHESNNIGLITCERIMKLHHGAFQKYEVEGEFTVKLTIPME